MKKLLAMKHAYLHNEDGATAIEYGLMAAAIALAIITIVFTLGGTVEGVFDDVNTDLAAAGSGGGGGTP